MDLASLRKSTGEVLVVSKWGKSTIAISRCAFYYKPYLYSTAVWPRGGREKKKAKEKGARRRFFLLVDIYLLGILIHRPQSATLLSQTPKLEQTPVIHHVYDIFH
jgi:hypothetical protein